MPTREPSLAGQPFTFRATVKDATGVPTFRWNFGDGTRTEYAAGDAQVTHTYADAGHYTVLVSIQDPSGPASVGISHTVHHPLTPRPPSVSAPIVYDRTRNRVFVVNQDNDSISAVDTAALTKVAEVPVYRRPEALALAPDGKIWVVHRDDYALAIVDPDRSTVERGSRFPYASQPMGIAFSPTGDAAYVTLMAIGKLLKLDAKTGSVIGELDVGPWPRGVSVSHDGRDVYVTRFISPDSGGEITQVDGPALKIVKRIVLAPDTTTLDSDARSRGVPNYLFSIGLSPDGRQAWVSQKKDNVFRGTMRDGSRLNEDNTVRPMVSVIDLGQGAEVVARRIDLDDRCLPAYVSFSALGDYAFVNIAASNMIEVRDSQTGGTVTAIGEAGLAPRGSVLDGNHRLFVQGSLSRNVVVFDLTDLLVSGNYGTPHKLADISTVAQEKLSAQVLRGKQVFHGAADGRMTVPGYLTCATCHFDGFEDGRVYDLSSRGEGFRNTISLLGRRGTGHGRLDWTGDMDEVQDVESLIRELFSGHGFLPDDVYAVGTRREALGDPKAKLSEDLDAMAIYVTSLDHVEPSPHRTADGKMTADAHAGKLLFDKLGCGFCHSGPDLTDSPRGVLHDVGTVMPTSGSRNSKPLEGLDTPTLLGVWQTAPYLHDGSAATLRDVLTTKNARDQHGFTSALSAKSVDQLVAYMLQLDGDPPLRPLPFETAVAPEPTNIVDGGAPAKPPPTVPDEVAGCACGLSHRADVSALKFFSTMGLVVLGFTRRRRAN